MVAASTKHRVLVVDDDPDCRQMLSSLVAQAGYQVDSVADAGMAMSILATRPPDLVLLDAHLLLIAGGQREVAQRGRGPLRREALPRRSLARVDRGSVAHLNRARSYSYLA